MDTSVVSSGPQSPAHIPASQTGLKPCLQRSCRGVMLYFPPHLVSANDTVPGGSWRSNEPVCLGLSTARSGPAPNLRKVHEAREIPVGSAVDYSVVLGHAVYESSNSAQESPPPGCMTGLEILRFSHKPITEAGVSVAATTAGTELSSPPSTLSQQPLPSYLASFANSFRILTSDADANARISRTWASIVNFDMTVYVDKFQKQASKNMGCMSKWLRDLQDAVSKPKS